MSAAEDEAAASTGKEDAAALTGAGITTPPRVLNPGVSVLTQRATRSPPPNASDAAKASTVAGLLERWPSSAAALLAQTMAYPKISQTSDTHTGRLPVTVPLHGCGQSDHGMSPPMLNLLQSGAFMHAHPTSLLSAPQGQAAALMSQGCTADSVSAADAATVSTHLSTFPGSEFWGLSALNAASATPPFLSNAAAASLLTAANVDTGNLACCFSDKLSPGAPREQPQRLRLPQQRQQQQQQLSIPHSQQPAGCSPQEQQLLSIPPLLMVMPAEASGSDSAASRVRVMGGTREDTHSSSSFVSGGAPGIVSRETLPKVVGVRYDKVNKTWRASWYDPQSKRRVERKFSVNKLGFINAYNLATECRKLQEKKLGLRDRSGRKQSQQHSSSLPSTTTMQQISSPTASVALTAATFPHFDLHSSSATTGGWESTVSSVSPPINLSLLGVSTGGPVKTFSNSSSSSSTTLGRQLAPPAGLLPMASLLSFTDQQLQRDQLHRQQQLHHQQQQLQQQELHQQPPLRQSSVEAPLDVQQLQHLGATSGSTSTRPSRATPDSNSYRAQTIAGVAKSVRHPEKPEVAGATTGGAPVLSEPMSVLSPHLLDLGTSRQQQHQQQRTVEDYTAHHAAMLRRSFQAFGVEKGFMSTSSSGAEQLQLQSSPHGTSASTTQLYYSYTPQRQPSNCELPAEVPSTPKATTSPSVEIVARALRVEYKGPQGGCSAAEPTAQSEGACAPVRDQEQRALFAEQNAQNRRKNSPLLRATISDPVWDGPGSRGEKRRLEQALPQQQRRTTARLTSGKTDMPASTTNSSDMLHQHDHEGIHPYDNDKKEEQSAFRGSRLPPTVEGHNDKGKTASTNRASRPVGAVLLDGEDRIYSAKCQRNTGVNSAAVECAAPNDSVSAPSLEPPPSIDPLLDETDVHGYKSPNKGTEDASKDRSGASRNRSACPPVTGVAPKEPFASHEKQWGGQDEKSSCSHNGSMLEETARGGDGRTKVRCSTRGDPHSQQSQHHDDELPADKTSEPTNVKCLSSLTQNFHGNTVAKGGDSNKSRLPSNSQSLDEKTAVCAQRLMNANQLCGAEEQQQETLARGAVKNSDYDTLCGLGTQKGFRQSECQHLHGKNGPLYRQELICCDGELHSQNREKEDPHHREMTPPLARLSAALHVCDFPYATITLSRRKQREALLSAASFFAPSSPLGGPSFSLAAYAIASAAEADVAGGTKRRNSFSARPAGFLERCAQYSHKGIFTTKCSSAVVCCCGHTGPILQEAGTVGSGVLTTRFGGRWCRCRVRCGYNSSLLERSSRGKWHQQTEPKPGKRGQLIRDSLPTFSRTDAKRLSSLRLSKLPFWVRRPFQKEKRGEDETLRRGVKSREGHSWPSECDIAFGEEADVSLSVPFDCCTNELKASAAVEESVEYRGAPPRRDVEYSGKGGKDIAQQPGSKEVFLLVKELLLLLLQSLQEALNWLCKGRVAVDHEQREGSGLADYQCSKKKRGAAFDRCSNVSEARCTSFGEDADSSSNSSSCDFEGTAAETGPPDYSSSLTNKEVLACVAAVERHTRHVRSAGQMDELVLYTNVFEGCIRTKLAPTELPPLQLIQLLQQLMKAQVREATVSKQAVSKKQNMTDYPSSTQSLASSKEETGRSWSVADTQSGSPGRAGGTLHTKDNNFRIDGPSLRDKQQCNRSQHKINTASDARVKISRMLFAEHHSPRACSNKEPEVNRRSSNGSRDEEIVDHKAAATQVAEKNFIAAHAPTLAATRLQKSSADRQPHASIGLVKKIYVPSGLKKSADHRKNSRQTRGDPPTRNQSSSTLQADVSSEPAAQPSEKKGTFTIVKTSEKATDGTATTCSRPSRESLHEQYTRGRHDFQTQHQRSRSAEAQVGFSGKAAREPDDAAAVCANVRQTRTASVDTTTKHMPTDEEQPGVASDRVGCVTHLSVGSHRNCSTAFHSNSSLLARRDSAGADGAPRLMSDGEAAKSRLDLLASEIYGEHEDAMLPRARCRVSKNGGDSVGAKVEMGLLPLCTAAAEFEDVPKRVPSRGAGMTSGMCGGEHSGGQRILDGATSPLNPHSLPALDRVGELEEMRRSSRSICSHTPRSTISKAADTLSPQVQGRCTEPYSERGIVGKGTNVNVEMDNRVFGSRTSTTAPNCTFRAIQKQSRTSQEKPEAKRITSRGASEFASVIQAGQETFSTRKGTSSSSYDLAANPPKDSLAELLL